MIHYIPNTNEKYSITEDGIITMHYFFSSKRNKIQSNRLVKPIISKGNSPSMHILINEVRTKPSVRTLIYITFGFTKCKHCDCKIKLTKKRCTCNKCKKEIVRKYVEISIEDVSRNYTAKLLKIKSKEVPVELQEIYKNQLKTKRLIKLKSNESNTLQSFKQNAIHSS